MLLGVLGLPVSGLGSLMLAAMVSLLQPSWEGATPIGQALLLLVLVLPGAVIGLGVCLSLRGFWGWPRAGRVGWLFGAVLLLHLAVMAALVGLGSIITFYERSDPWVSIVTLVLAFAGLVIFGWLGGLFWRRARDPVPGARWGRRVEALTSGLFLWVLVVINAGMIGAQACSARHPHRFYTTDCMNNVGNMSQILCERSRRHGWPRYGGKRFVLSLVLDDVVDVEHLDNVRVFFCVHRMEDCRAAQDPEVWLPFLAGVPDAAYARLTSYAGRRNDEAEWRLTEDMDLAAEAILGCRTHRDGVVLGFADGKRRFVDREELGLRPDEPIVFGDDAKHPWLRALSED